MRLTTKCAPVTIPQKRTASKRYTIAKINGVEISRRVSTTVLRGFMMKERARMRRIMRRRHFIVVVLFGCMVVLRRGYGC